MRRIPESTTLLFDLWALANATHAALDEALRDSGLTADEFAVYSVLRRPDGRTPSELAAAMQLPATTVSSVVRRLEQRGHVERATDPTDRRSSRLTLTPAGEAAHARARKAFRPFLARVEAGLGIPVDRARDVLDRIDEAVRAAADA
ncbi:MAG: MarR family transcriptional regulator [Acidimicrobiales bacterium]